MPNLIDDDHNVVIGILILREFLIVKRITKSLLIVDFGENLCSGFIMPYGILTNITEMKMLRLIRGDER